MGDPYDSSVVTNGGAVYMFNSVTGALQQTFLNPSGVGTPDDILEYIEEFGQSVSGFGTDKVLVGAWKRKVNDISHGGAYLFDASTGGLLHTFNSPTSQAYGRFGYAMAEVGDKIAISETRWDGNGPEEGAVHIFDGETYAYERTLFDPTPRQAGQFGYSLAVLGDKLLVGGGYGAYAFDPDTGELLLSVDGEILGDWARTQVASLGENILVGGGYYSSPELDRIGRAYVFDGQTGELLLTVENPGPDSYEYFGSAVAAVGDYIAVGADYDDTLGTHSGIVYLFDVPEPATLSLLAAGGVAMLRRRRRK